MAKKSTHKEVELAPDAWERFERAVDVVAKSPPQHRTKEKKRKPTIGQKERKERRGQRPK
jgi:hypothetical protein